MIENWSNQMIEKLSNQMIENWSNQMTENLMVVGVGLQVKDFSSDHWCYIHLRVSHETPGSFRLHQVDF